MHVLIALVKWLFTLHQLVWFLVGGLIFGGMTYFHMKLKGRTDVRKLCRFFIGLSICTLGFAILWGFDSYVENEIQAANMGYLVFGGLSALFGVIAYRLFPKNKIEVVEQ